MKDPVHTTIFFACNAYNKLLEILLFLYTRLYHNKHSSYSVMCTFLLHVVVKTSGKCITLFVEILFISGTLKVTCNTIK